MTGGYSGIGVETARALHSASAKVIVPARDHDKAATALDGLDGVEIEAMDLLDPASIDAFAERFLASGQPLHILVNSAGIMACPLARDARGYELQFSTNHLGHFHLVARLWPALRKANGARVVSVSSWGHRHSPVVFEDPNFERRDYDRWLGYGQSKTANILFALAVDERGKAEGVRAFSLHPGGIVDTGLGKHLSREELRKAGVIDENGKPRDGVMVAKRPDLLIRSRRSNGSAKFRAEAIAPVMQGLGTALILAVVALARDRDEQTQAAASAEVRALQSRMNPDFLFNALNTLAALATIAPREIPRAAGRLRHFLRAGFDQPGRALVPLEEELTVVRAYLACHG